MINNIKLLFIGNCIVYTNKDCMPKVQLSDHTVWLSSDVMRKTMFETGLGAFEVRLGTNLGLRFWEWFELG